MVKSCNFHLCCVMEKIDDSYWKLDTYVKRNFSSDIKT